MIELSNAIIGPPVKLPAGLKAHGRRRPVPGAMNKTEVVKKPKSTGSALVKMCLEYLRLKGVYAFRVGNSGVRRVQNGREFWTFSGTKGVADIIGVLPGGRLLAVECKEGTGKLSKDQKVFLESVNASGGLGICARSLDDVAKVV